MDQNDHFIILTGGPGVGKTTLLKALQEEGFETVPEEARRIIQEQLEGHGDGLPWKNKYHYAALMLAASTASYGIQKSKNHRQFVFFDRGIPDTLAYIEMENLAIPQQLLDEAKNYRYHTKVFILSPWKDIYENDNERKQTWQEAEATFTAMKNSYSQLGYVVVEVPKTTVAQRVQFILENLESRTE